VNQRISNENDTEFQNEDETALHWSEDVQGLMQDLNEPIPEPPLQQTMLNRVNILLRCLCYFILCWQVITRVSDAAVEWLLTFLGSFLQTLSYGLDSEFFKSFMLFFPTSIYMLHRISNLKRDD